MIVFDNETTGLSKPIACPLNEQPQIIEFAAIKLDDKSLKERGRMTFLCNPGIPLPAEITKITGLKDKDLADKPPFVNFYPSMADFYLGERFLVAHNLDFDRSMLTFELQRIDKLTQFPWPPKHICTVEKSYYIKNKRLKQTDLYEIAMGKGKTYKAHRAMDDVEALCDIIRWLRKEKAL